MLLYFQYLVVYVNVLFMIVTHKEKEARKQCSKRG
jgi:hypothetical protein